jgi:hypothetical protein
MGAVEVGGIGRSNQPGNDNKPIFLRETFQHLRLDGAYATHVIRLAFCVVLARHFQRKQCVNAISF